MKRYATIVLLVLVLGGALGYFFYTFWRNTQSRPLEEALLHSTSFYINTPDALSVLPTLRNMPYGNQVYALPVFARLETQLAAFDSVLRATGYTLGGTRLIASLYATGAEQYDWLFLVDGSKTDAQTLLGKLSEIQAAQVGKRLYKDETVLDITMPGATVPFSCASLNGILMGSFSAFLVEECIVQLKEKDPLAETDPRFRKISNLASKEAGLSLFINPDQLKALGKQVVDGQQSALLAHLSSISSWLAMDVSFRNSSILLGGYALPDGNGLLSAFNTSGQRSFAFDKVLPINTAFFVAQDIKLNLESPTGVAASYLSSDWLVPFACYGLQEPLDPDYAWQWFLALPVLEEDLARQSLQEMVRVNSSGPAFSDVFNGIAVGQLTNDSALVQGLGIATWLPLSNPYYAIFKGHVYFANSLNTLKGILGKVANGQTLSSSPAYANHLEQLSANNNVYCYLNPARMGELLPRLLLASVLEGQGSGYKNFSPVGVQFNYDEGVFFAIALLQYQAGGSSQEYDEVEGDSSSAAELLAWRLPLDTPMVGKPFLVTNHTTGEMEVLLQDLAHNVYLVNKAGKVLWKKRLEDRIMGEVYQIDLYKNGKLQYLFNTQQKLHLLDRNGNNVEQFPVGLAAKAVNGIFMMHDGKKNYQYFVACDNYKVYGYTANGKPLQGWNPKPRVGTIPFPLQYVQAQGKDYLILTNADGTLLFYNKNGERHQNPIRLDAKFNQPFYIHQHSKGFTLINASNDRMLFTVNAKGEVKETTADGLPNYSYFTCTVEDSTLHYVFVASDKLTFTTPDLVTIASYAPTQAIDLPVQVFRLASGEVLLGLSSAIGNEMYLINTTGELLPGLPLKGNTQMAIGGFFEKDRIAVLVGDAEGNLNAYRLP